MKKTALILIALFATMAVAEAQPRFLAHRGGRHEQEENTLEAFKATYDAGCHGFETDIHITADGKYVIIHDHYLSRMTDGEGIVETTSSSYIRSLTTKKGHKVPLLEELADYFSGCETLYVEWELKTNEEYYPQALLHRYCDEVYEIIMSRKPADALYVFSSFDVRPLLYIKSKHPDAEVQYITGEPVSHKTVDYCTSLGISRIAATINRTSREAVKYAHDKGMKVNLWPGDKPEDTALAAFLGADYPCTDIPQQVMKYVADHGLDIVCR